MGNAPDVVIAGAGVAGASLAVMLGRAGLSVELYDRRRFPREKPCGEGLMPAGVAVLRRLGLDREAGGRPLRGVRYHGWGIDAESDFPSDLPLAASGGGSVFALGVRRLHLDRVLFEAARATPGVRTFEGTRVDGAVVEHGRAVGLRVGGTTRRAALVVAADGARSAVRASLGLDAAPARRRRAGVRRHFQLSRAAVRSGLQPDAIEIFVADDHELYVTPLPDDQILIAALADSDTLAANAGAGRAHATFARWIAAQPLLRERLEGAVPLTPLGGRAPLGSGARAGFAPGAVLLGDAAGFVDPITAGGMAQALVTAELLAPCVLGALAVAGGGARGDAWLRRFDRRRRALLRDYLLLTRVMLLLVRHPPLARGTLRLMRSMPRLMAHLIGVAGGVRRLLPGSPRPSVPAGGVEVLHDGRREVVEIDDVGGEVAAAAVRPDGV